MLRVIALVILTIILTGLLYSKVFKRFHLSAEGSQRDFLVKTANIISVIAAFGMIFGFISIFFTSLLTGLVIAVVCIGIFSVSDKREKTLMKQAASAQSRKALDWHEAAQKRLEICKGYLKAKKEAEDNGISPADVQDLVADLMQQN